MNELSLLDIGHLSPDALMVFRAVRAKDHPIVEFERCYANPNAESLTHRGVLLLDACQPEPLNRLLLRWAHQVENGGRCSEDLYCTVEGRDFVLHANVTWFRDCLVVWLRDVTTERRLEGQAHELEVRERLMSILAHDLSHPIASIRLSTQLLLAVGGLSQAQRKSLIRIEASTERATEMTRQLLDFAHIQYGKGLPVTLAPADLETVCRQVISEFKVTHPERDIQLELKGESWGQWDEHRMAQAVSNLIGNALEHGGEAGPIRVRAWADEGLQRLEVHNLGAPIPQEILSSIFEPFRRGVDTGPGRSGGGLGLGLYIVNEIARSHRGKVEVHSSAEDGTRFVLSIPRGVAFKPRVSARTRGRKADSLKLERV